MKKKKCGDNGTHWYDAGKTCECGQVPTNIFFAAGCSCGAYLSGAGTVHLPNCSHVIWGKKRNLWIDKHPEVKPPIEKVFDRVRGEIGPIPEKGLRVT